jgi:hypothetical protein
MSHVGGFFSALKIEDKVNSTNQPSLGSLPIGGISSMRVVKDNKMSACFSHPLEGRVRW